MNLLQEDMILQPTPQTKLIRGLQIYPGRIADHVSYQDPSFDQDPIKKNSHGSIPTWSKQLDLDTRSGRTYRGMRAPMAGSRGNSRFRRSWLLPCSIPDPTNPPPLAGTEQIKNSATNPTPKEISSFCFRRNRMRKPTAPAPLIDGKLVTRRGNPQGMTKRWEISVALLPRCSARA
jgi:hypothetical protein